MVRLYLALANCMEVEFLNYTEEISEQFPNRPNQNYKDRHFLEKKIFCNLKTMPFRECLRLTVKG